MDILALLIVLLLLGAAMAVAVLRRHGQPDQRAQGSPIARRPVEPRKPGRD